MLNNIEVLKTVYKYQDPECGKFEYINALTKEMDKHIIDTIKELRVGEFITYIYRSDTSKNRMAIRFPGATRGGIEIDDNAIITSIILDENTCFGGIGCYERTVSEAVQSFIGKKIEFVE